MRRYFLYILLLSVLFATQQVSAQEFHVTNYKASEGLGGSHFGEITQDQLGFIWVVSDAGLFKFDGEKIKKIKSGEFSSIITRKNGSLWASSTEGIYSIISTPDTSIIKEELAIKNPSGTPQAQLYEDSKKRLWVINSEVILRKQKNGFKNYEIKGVRHMRFEMVEDDYGNIWMASSEGSILYRYSPRSDLFRKIAIQPHIGAVNAMFNAGEGRIWLAGATLYEVKIDSRLENLEFKKIVIPESPINFIAQGPMESIFVGTRGEGLQQLFLRDSSNQLEPVKDYTNPYQVLDLNFKDVNHIFVGNDDDLWISTDAGLYHLHQNLFGALKALPKEPVTTITKTFDGTVYVGMSELHQVKRENNRYIRKSIDLPNDATATSVIGQKNNLLIGTSKGELYRRFNDQFETLVNKEAGLGYIKHLFSDKIGNIWIFQETNDSDFAGVHKLSSDGKLIHLGKNAGFSAKANLAQEAKDGIIYFGGNSNESYLYAYNPNSNKVENISLPLPFQTRSKIRVLDLAIDYENKVWLATSEGLLKYDKEKKEIKRVHLGVNYTYEEITAVDLMPDSSLWLSTEIFGLIRYKNNDFALFDESSGLTIKSFNQRAMLIDNEGYLWVGTPKGIEISQIPFPQPKPTNQPMVLDGENLLKKSKKNGKYIYIVSSDSKINFRFHSLTYPPVDVQYQTRIAQLGGNWSDIDESEDFVVNNLAEGDYVLQVRSKQRGGHTWSEPLNIDINVQTVWYKTAVAMFAYILILFGLIYSFIKWNERRLRLKNEHLEELIETRTREITNQKEEIEAQKDEMERVNVRLQEVNEEKNYYVGVVAHDLKSPLNRIKALIELIHLEKDVFSDSIEQYLSLISTSIDHQRAIVTDILDLQAIESQKINFNMEELAIVPFMKEVTSEFEPSANKKYLKLHFDSHISNQAQIEVDSHYFQQIVENLISNAIKFSSQGKNIFVILDEVDNHIQISVKDEGPGLSEEDKSKLFQKFQKLSARPTAGEKSNGLGLSIVKLFAESMGGKVWCESEERKGATFKVQIPKVQLQNQSAEKREVKLGKV